MPPLRAAPTVLEDVGRTLFLVVTQLQEPTVPVAVQPVDCVSEADTEVGTGLNVRGHGLEEAVAAATVHVPQEDEWLLEDLHPSD